MATPANTAKPSVDPIQVQYCLLHTNTHAYGLLRHCCLKRRGSPRRPFLARILSLTTGSPPGPSSSIAMDYKPYSVRTPQELRDISVPLELEVTLQLNSKEIQSSASRWTRRHLIAYRLLTAPDEAFLPALGLIHDLDCPICLHRPTRQKLDRLRLDAILGENPRNLCNGLEGELMRLPDGSFWVALSRAARRDAPEEGRVYPQRHRSQVQQDGFVDSTQAIMGSSSPTMPSASEFGSDRGEFITEDEHDARRGKPEEVTVHLATSFLQLALHICLIQDSSGYLEVRPRVERRITEASVAGGVLIAAEDDGGICRMRRLAHGWREEHPSLALLEAKRSFRDVRFDERTNECIPIVSDETLAQYLGEAVITWKGRQDLLKHECVPSIPELAVITVFAARS